MNKLLTFLKDEEGATAPEYALIAALIAVTIIIAVGNAGAAIEALFQKIADEVNAALA
ncbi:MAG: Flp family type IVb pilin [Thermodesulfovibrionales bacterium]